jgi:hypothetical protein
VAAVPSAAFLVAVFLKTAASRHECSGPSTPPTNTRATRARSARPASVTLSRTGRPVISAPAFPAALVPGKHPGTAGGHRDARSTQRRTSSRVTPARTARPWPSVESRRCTPTVLVARTPVRYMSVTTAPHRPAVTHPDTWRDKKKTAPRAAFPQPTGRFRRWWQVLGSNQRRLSRRFYSPLSPHESPPLTSAYAFRGAIPGRRRPLCVRWRQFPAGVQATDEGAHGHGPRG